MDYSFDSFPNVQLKPQQKGSIRSFFDYKPPTFQTFLRLCRGLPETEVDGRNAWNTWTRRWEWPWVDCSSEKTSGNTARKWYVQYKVVLTGNHFIFMVWRRYVLARVYLHIKLSKTAGGIIFVQLKRLRKTTWVLFMKYVLCINNIQISPETYT